MVAYLACSGSSGMVLDNIWANKVDLDDTSEGSRNWKISSGKLNADGISINSSLHLPNAVENILFYDKVYLITKIDGEINSYKISDEYDTKEIQINDSYSTKMNCRNIDFSRLPQYIRDSVLEEEI